MPRKPATPKPKALLSRPEVVGLCKRFLKEGAYDPMRDPIALYTLLKQFPNRDFWLAYTLPFRLNAMYWFKGKDGQDQLKRDWDVFQLDIPAQPAYALETAKVGEDVVVDKKPRTVADLLR